ncbi:P-loop containing nucleoside triphosphate hydrolase protein [Pyrenochaeta sp. MPI-SDFR-AT-0127]|nr:P-loop containing nucleoside triphosphate hydrolase protein [Pyrenochaeta sp. MPI-SDFR-AT-0127]
MSLEELKAYIGTLQSKVRQLEAFEGLQSDAKFRILFRIQDAQAFCVYLDHPEWIEAGRTLRSRKILHNFDLYLERNKNISFIVFRDFNQSQNASNRDFLDEPKHLQESIYPVSHELGHAIERLLLSHPGYSSLLRDYKATRQLKAPYLFFYHNREQWDKMMLNFTTLERQQLLCMANYIKKSFGQEYLEADALFDQGKVSRHFLQYLFQPGDILVQSTDMKEYQGYLAESWPQFISSHDDLENNTEIQANDSLNPNAMHEYEPLPQRQSNAVHWDQMYPPKPSYGSIKVHELDIEKANKSTESPLLCPIDTWTWAYRGNFVRKKDTFNLQLPPLKSSGHRDDTFEIQELDIYPMKYASALVLETLKRRGQMFWKCRKRRLVSYQEDDGKLDEASGERYMIDFNTYRSLHPFSEDTLSNRLNQDKMDEKQMEMEEPPDEQFQYLVPTQIKGYNLRTKKWHDLKVDRVCPVVWNTTIFETLVLHRKTKELINALISKQIKSQKSTDVIANKGNGLIMLLHGGPGTGKTLTAEGVAEIAKKPLYRVTCGDVGTKAEDVEKYLESVLHLGKIWDCVVLLDEAEVFLEQRTLDNLQRNALVSVFLRVLEYHEGILILTSNRVGTFDEAFRSRIQIAIHYPSLGPSQRRKIWNNFIDRLESFKDDTVDAEDLRGHIEDLQKFEMNGRQIRNAITTARQYAEWKGEKMDYEYLKDVVDVASKFDAYSTKLKGGFTDDQLAEEEGVR